MPDTRNDIARMDQSARRSRIVVHNGIVYLAGQVADDKSAAIDGQTRQVLHKIDELLARAGTDKSRLLTAQIWLRTMDDYAAMNAVWDAWVVPGQTPTRCCASVAALADPDWRIEVVVTAAL
jgi:enamine deaminase RidA (YjgF/YER057c/UK114 family)